MKNCNICYLRDAKPCYECSACMAGDSHFRPAPKAKKQSNADHIRAMSGEELAEFLSDFKDCAGDCLIGKGVKDCSGICATRETLKMWLQQPAEEDA